jgi:hypothetical protein
MSSSTSTPAIAELPAKSSAKETPPQTVIPTDEIIDPAPFVGTRQSGPVPTVRQSTGLPFLSIATPPSTPMVPVTGGLTITLAEIIRRIEKGELRVTGYHDGMSAEATLVAVLSAMLTRER